MLGQEVKAEEITHMESKAEVIDTHKQEESKKVEPDKDMLSANVISTVIYVFSYIIGYIILFSEHIRVAVFTFICITLMNFGITKPLALVLKEFRSGKRKGITFHRVVLGISIVYIINAIYCTYQIIYTYPLNDHKLYWLCKLVVIMLLPYSFLIQYNNIIDRKDELLKKSNTRLKRFSEIAGLVAQKSIPILMIFILNYQSLHVVDLSRINNPSGITVVRSLNNMSKDIVIKNENRALEFDIKEINFFLEEIEKHSLENIRYLELLNFNMEEEAREVNYAIYFDYKNNEDRYILLDSNRRVRLGFIDIYEDEIIINTHDRQNILPKKDDKYRLKLPKEIIQRLNEMIKIKLEQKW